MKKLIIIMITVFVPALMMAQNTPLSSFYDRYVSDPGFETTEILPGSMSFNWEKETDIPALKEMLQQIESVRILKYKSEAGKMDSEKLWKKMLKTADDEQYTEVVTISADKLNVKIYMAKNPSGTTREIAMLEQDENGLMLMTMTGDMDFSSFFNPENMQSFREMAKYVMQHKGDCKSEIE